MLKEIFSLLDSDGNIQITANRKGDVYTLSVVPFEKQELSISLVGTVEEVERDMVSITPKYKAVIKSATEQVEALATKVKEATKSKVKTVNKGKIAPTTPLETSIKENKELEEEAEEQTQEELVTKLESTIAENNKVLDANTSFEKETVKVEVKKEEQSLF